MARITKKTVVNLRKETPAGIYELRDVMQYEGMQLVAYVDKKWIHFDILLTRPNGKQEVVKEFNSIGDAYKHFQKL